MDKKLIITINREYGSGGRIIGQQLSEKLGIPYYDDEIIKMASEHSAVGEQYFRMNDERPGNNILQRIIIIAGPSGVGKTTISKYLTEKYNIPRVVTHTTRPIRKGEIPGKSYYFENDESFKKLHFFEHVKYGEYQYGSSKEALEKADLVLFLLNSSEELTDDDRELLKLTEGKTRYRSL